MTTRFRAAAVVVLLAWLSLATADDKKRPALPDNKTIDSFTYQFAPKVLGPAASLGFNREGKVYYSYSSEPHTGSGGKVVTKEWTISNKEAAELLQGLLDDGLLDLETNLGGKFPNHHIHMTYGRWHLSTHVNAISEKVGKRLLPLLQKAHPEQWKSAPW